MTSAPKKNRLAKAQSPYLRQHDANPVDWYEWGDEAFEKASREGKPIFLSIGYSTCHWCHVMAHESFENPAIAAILNEHFVSIKVDREERPDIDQVYMTAAQALTGGGGWPLSIWMTPDRKPFFSGTYFPPEDRWGRAGFPTILRKIADLWKSDRKRLQEDAERLTDALAQSDRPPAGPLDPKILEETVERFRGEFDSEHGGFGGAPKFPRSIVLELLLRSYARTKKTETLEMIEKTLTAMRAGGMYDQLGGGFHRYSTDERWLVPHFEKMLYDNALLARAYTQAYQLTGKEEYARTVRETLDYVLRDMTSKEGGFYSAEDADSPLPEGGNAEGAFYLWNPPQVKAVVPGEEGDRLCAALGIVEGGNFESPHPGDPKGMSVLHRIADAPEPGMRKLFEARSKRPRPHLDDKILADWNGLMIGAMAFAGSVLDEPKYVQAAERAAKFLLRSMRRADGRWLHVGSIPGFLDDYASLAEGFWFLHQATQKTEFAEVAVRTAEILIEDFEDSAGGFFHTAKSSEKLIARRKESYDGALPSGNSVAALALLRLANLTSRDDFRKAAQASLNAFADTIARQPVAYPYHLCALDARLGPSQEIVIVGDSPSMIRAIRRRFLPNTVVVVASEAKLFPMTAERGKVDGKPTAYVCSNGTCKLPTTSVEELTRQIDRK